MNLGELTDAELDTVAGGYSPEGMRIIKKYLVPLFGEKIFAENPNMVIKICEEYVSPKYMCKSLEV